MVAPPDYRPLLDFWFAPEGQGLHLRAVWFQADRSFDEACRWRFADLWEEGRRDGLRPWAEEPEGMLALIILLDQIPRNLFRGTARAFESDGLALSHAEQALVRGYDTRLQPLQRPFLYLPFEHSEDPLMQDRAVALFGALAQAEPRLGDYLDFARRHQEVIRRFGRFPHRNAALGRASTPEEEEYLAQPGAGF